MTAARATNGGRVRVQRAALEDLPALVDLERTCFLGVYAGHGFGSEELRYYLRNPHAVVAVARREDRVVGHVTGILCTGSRGHLARVHSIAVAPAERRGGIGRRLLQYFLSEAAVRGRTEVLLEVAPGRRGARRLFEGLGFRVEERLPDYYGARKDGLSMRAGTGAG